MSSRPRSATTTRCTTTAPRPAPPGIPTSSRRRRSPIAIITRAQDAVLFDPALGLDFARVVHGDQRFVHRRPILAGDELSYDRHRRLDPGARRQRRARRCAPRSPTPRATRSAPTYGTLVSRSRVVSVALAERRRRGRAAAADADGSPAQQLVRYAGASGDFNPIHWNERAARAVGLPGVIAHGMLTMAPAGRVVTDWVGRPRPRQGVRDPFHPPRCRPRRRRRRDRRGDAPSSRPLDPDARTARVDITAKFNGQTVLGKCRAACRRRRPR